MNANVTFENTEKLLKKHNQSHLLTFWGELNAAERRNLIAQIRKLDFAKIDGWVANFIKKSFSTEINADLVPAQSYSYAPEEPGQKRKYDKAVKLGKELIMTGKVAALVVAGGQGTRLGFDGPKGDFPISPVKKKTLFQIFAENIKAVAEKYRTPCPWYIMSSPLNYTETKKIFRANNYYGLKKSNVFIFQQGTLPNFSFDGKILLADKANIASSPDGHGGCLKALCESGAVDDMKKRGIEFLSYWQIDNPLVNIFDPLFIGLHAIDRAEMSSKALIKARPKEKVGNFCLLDGKVTVIEYSDFPAQLAKRQNPDGSLVFQLGSIAIHIISVSFIDRLNAEGISLPLHRAVKKIPCIDQHGRFIDPDEPNGIKLETFIFDALPMASRSIILETRRSEEFAPTKNAVGIDSVKTTKQMMVARAADWLESAGVVIPRKADGSVNCKIEIAPGFALTKEDIKAKLNHIPAIKPKDKLYLE